MWRTSLLINTTNLYILVISMYRFYLLVFGHEETALKEHEHVKGGVAGVTAMEETEAALHKPEKSSIYYCFRLKNKPLNWENMM